MISFIMRSDYSILIRLIAALVISFFHARSCNCKNLRKTPGMHPITFGAETCSSSATRPIVTTSAVPCPCFLRYAIVADEPTTWDIFFITDQSFREWRTSLYRGDPENVIESLSMRKVKTHNSSTVLKSPGINVGLNGTFRLVIRTNTDMRRCFGNWQTSHLPTSIVFESILTPCLDFIKNPNQNLVGSNVSENILSPASFKWMAEILRNGHVICSGVVISLAGFVVTAAHCDVHVRSNEIMVSVGDSNVLSRQLYEVNEVFVHPDFSALKNKGFSNDVCVVRLEGFDAGLGKNGVLSLNYDHSIPRDGDIVTVADYGYISKKWDGKIIRRLDLPAVSENWCSETEPFSSFDSTIHLCVGYAEKVYGIYQGSGGSPLRYILNDSNGSRKEILVGLKTCNYNCERSDTPNVYTRVSTFATWIDAVIAHALATQRSAFWSNKQIIIPFFLGLSLIIIAILVAAFLLWRRLNKGRAHQDFDNYTESDMPSETGISG